MKYINKMMNEGETEELQTTDLEYANDTELDDELEVAAPVTNSKRNIVRVFEPVSKGSTEKIMNSIKRSELCIVNFKNVSEDEANQILNQLHGAIYALDGELELVHTEIAVCVPKTYMYNKENIG